MTVLRIWDFSRWRLTRLSEPSLTRRQMLDLEGLDGVDVGDRVVLTTSLPGELASELEAREGIIEGETRLCSGVGVVGLGPGRFRWYPGDTTPANGGTVLGAGGGRWRRLFESGAGSVSVAHFGAKGDGVSDDTAKIQAAIDTGASRVLFHAGTYKTSSTLWVRHDCVLSGDCPGSDSSPTISYTGTGFALNVNSDALSLGPGAVFLVKNLRIERLRFTAPSGSGIRLGSAIVGRVVLEDVEMDTFSGKALELGGSVYFATLRKCHFVRSRGVSVVGSACDLFTVDNCGFYKNKDYDIDIATPTFHIHNSDFEVNEGAAIVGVANKANIRITATLATSGYGTVSDCRFGPEDEGVQVPAYDIELAQGTSAISRGVRLMNNRHFSPSVVRRKTAPILVNAGLAQFSMIGAVVTNYLNGEEYVTSDNADGAASSSTPNSNFIDDLYKVADGLLPIFVQIGQNEGSFIACRSAQTIAKYQVVSFEDWTDGVGARGLPRVKLTINDPDFSRRVLGVALAGVVGDKNLCVARDGCIIHTASPTAFDTSGSYVGAPIYLNAAGYIGFTPTNPVIQVGRVARVAAAGSFVVETPHTPLWSSMPTSGTWRAGDFAPKSNPAVAGAVLSQYVVRGWNRLTTGSAHVLGTDWVEARELTGT